MAEARADRHAGDLRAARRGLLHAAGPPPGRDPRRKIDDLRQIEKRLDAEELAVQLADSVQEHRPVYGSD